jgi:hypothetical protein
MRVVELRQYTLRPGLRDVLIDLFEREFVEPQEAEGITLIGQFRDLDDPDRFVWLRGFPDMETRRRALAAFYGGRVWRAHRDAANATMIDSDDVLLLRPLEGAGNAPPGERAPSGAAGDGAGRVVIGVHSLDGPDDALPRRFLAEGLPALRDVGAASIAAWVTEDSANTFPQLPVREGERVLVWSAAFADPGAAEAARGLFQAQSIQRLRLEPTARSRLRAW